MRYAGLKKNDATNCLAGLCVSLWTQGCPHHCRGCHNPETWDFCGGMEAPANIKEQIIEAISANGVQRNFSILGGEPLSSQNRKWVLEILNSVLATYPNIKIFLWSGWTIEELVSMNDSTINQILNKISYLIDGKFDMAQRDITLPLRGSHNQRIWEKVNDRWHLMT